DFRSTVQADVRFISEAVHDYTEDAAGYLKLPTRARGLPGGQMSCRHAPPSMRALPSLTATTGDGGYRYRRDRLRDGTSVASPPPGLAGKDPGNRGHTPREYTGLVCKSFATGNRNNSTWG